MRSYEVALIFKPTIEDERQQALIDKISGLITEMGGQTGELNKWGKRRLAYEINDQREGLYSFLPFQAETKVLDELEHVLKLSEELLRFMLVRMDEE